jgi:tRNA nucleotidyltransferase (CCA-adding enzyme)
MDTPLWPDALRRVLTPTSFEVVERAADAARALGLRLGVVGGVVRDALLGVLTTDLDFVVEGDARALADALAARHGGQSSGFAPFGTAQWTPPRAAGMPEHIDFAMARSEHYAHPGALPSVQPTRIEDDLRRRDYTVNALVLMLSPADEAGRLIDPHGGLTDLRAGVLRVLHDHSFEDDPTRIFRGARLAARCGLHFTEHTADLIPDALPVLDEVSGERLRTELRLILREPSGAQALRLLDTFGTLQAIEPSLMLTPSLEADLSAIHADPPADLESAAWCAWLCRLDPEALPAVALRLAFTAPLAAAVRASAVLLHDPQQAESEQPSAAYRALHGLPDSALHAAARIGSAALRHNATQYLAQWRHVRPATTGDTLRQRGIPPGPHYRQVLDRLKSAWLDGELHTDADEAALLDRLLAQL